MPKTASNKSIKSLDSIELEPKPYNGWVRTEKEKKIKLPRLSKDMFVRKEVKYVKQMEHSVRQMIGSTYLGLTIAGIDSAEQFSNLRGVKSVLFYIYHYLVFTLLIFFNVTTIIAIILSENNSLPLIIDFIRIFGAFYRFFCLKFQKNKFSKLIKKLENSLELFPNVNIQENNYSKFVAMVILYACVQGFALFRQIKDYRQYISVRYFRVLDRFIGDSKYAKLFVLIDVWIRSFLFRAVFISDIILGVALLKEVFKRQHLLTQILKMFCKRLSSKKYMESHRLLANFRETYLRVRECVLLYDNIYAPGMVLWISFFSLYYIAEINNVMKNIFKESNNFSYNFLVRGVAIFVISQGSLIMVARSTEEPEKTLRVVHRLSTLIDENDMTMNVEIQLLRDQIYINDVRLTCWQLFDINRNTIVRGVLMTVYYIVITLQMHFISNNS